MENVTDFNETAFVFRQGVWINDVVFNCIFFMVSIYLSIALVYHQAKVEKPKETKFLQLTLERKYIVLSKYTCISIAVFSALWNLSELVLNILEVFTVFPNDSTQQRSAAEVACNLFFILAAFAVSLGNFFVYFFLWLRQSIFYFHSSLNFLYNTYLKVFSFSVLISYLLFGIGLMSAYLIKVRYSLNDAGHCEIQVESADETAYLKILLSWNIVSILMQIMLLGLFIYPLLKQASWQNKVFGEGSKKMDQSMLKRVKKAVVLASVCLITDILTALAVGLVFEKNTNSSFFMYDINLAINHLVTIACSDNWKKLLWPWSIKCLTVSSSKVTEASTTSQQATHGNNSTAVTVTS